MLRMSGARPGGTSAAVGAAATGRLAPNFCPATSAMKASSAIAATTQGSDMAEPGLRSDGGLATPTGSPHRWQKRAPSISSAPHPAHPALPSVAPHSEQNFPDAVAPHFGHLAVTF